MKLQKMKQAVTIDTPLGPLNIEGNENGLTSIMFSKDDTVQFSKNIPVHLQETVNQIVEYFEGKRKDFTLKLAPEGTEFQKRVWKELLKIPFGKTVSYQYIAKQLGDPKAIRAAASANGKNPISIIIPCHRVIGKDGSLTGYAGGLHIKKWLLEHENPPAQKTLF